MTQEHPYKTSWESFQNGPQNAAKWPIAEKEKWCEKPFLMQWLSESYQKHLYKITEIQEIEEHTLKQLVQKCPKMAASRGVNDVNKIF